MLNMIEPYADEIIIRYRTNPITGREQYRRWNETKGVWVDVCWLDIP